MGVVQIPFGVDLLHAVADHIKTFPNEERGRIRVLLPHRRACRRLRALLGGQAQILPRILPLGEPDTAEFAIDDSAILPEVSHQTRWLLLTWLLRHARMRDSSQGTAEQDSLLAYSLGQAMDRLGEFDHSLSDLTIPEYADYGTHWERLADMMAVVQDFWPNWCAENHCLDAIARRNAVLLKLAENIHDPIIIAGSSGRAVAVQRLMQAVLAAPKGWVYLQGSEVISDPAIVRNIPSHPGYALARLCQKLDIAPESSEQSNFYRTVFRAQSEEISWRDQPPEHLQALVLPDRDAEVGVTALLIRAAFAEKKHHIAVICQDADFTDSLERWLTRWNISVDRVAGVPVQRTPEGRLLHLIMDIWCLGLNWVRLLAVLKHPLVHLGMTRAEVAQCTQRLEALVPEGYDERSVERAFARMHEADFLWLQQLQVLCTPPEEKSVQDFIIFWCTTFFALCQNPEGALPDSRAMRVITQWQDSMTRAAEPLGDHRVPVTDFAGMVLPMLTTIRVPSVARGVFSVSVLSAMEARLMRFDRVIIPMMNYAVVPHPPTPEPWLTRQHYQDCAMPPPEETLGLAAHDFIELCHQPEVFLLRSEKMGDRIVAASVWWERLDAAYWATGAQGMVTQRENARWQSYLAAVLEADENPSAGRPNPNPPLVLRPQSLSVTQIQTLFCNPYGLYVQQILRLEPRPVRMAETFAARRGNFLHQLVQDFVTAAPSDGEAWLLHRAETLIAEDDFLPLEALTLRYGVMRMARRFCAIERDFIGAENLLEISGKWDVSGVQIRGRADRVIIDSEGARILDYKSGTAPSLKSIQMRYEWQLPVLALMVRNGALGRTKIVTNMGYWRIGGSKTEGLQWHAPLLEEDFLAQIEQKLCQRLEQMQQAEDAFPAVPDPECLPNFTAIGHLMRAEEWLERPCDTEDEPEDPVDEY